jgi:hypothetical protein
MRKTLLLTLLCIVVCLGLACKKSSYSVDAPVSTASGTDKLLKAAVAVGQTSVVVDDTVFSDCAGEDIHFTGEYHVEIHTVTDGKGGLHGQVTANDHNLTGVGMTSGTKYRRVGTTVDRFNVSGPPPLVETFTNSFNLIGQGSKNNTILIETFHVTVSANGDVTASVDKARIECK